MAWSPRLRRMLGDEAVADPIGPGRHAEKPFDAEYLDQLRALHGLPAL